MDISVRNEQEKDHRRVEEITRSAFSYPERIERGGIGCPYEHWMVNELRKRDGIPELSLVAEIDNVIVGHIICSKAEVKTPDNVIPVLNFGPLSVLPEYYPQFGFKEASVWGVTDSNGYNYPAFMGMELVPGYLSHAEGGKYYESDIYDDSLNHDKVKEFDNLYFASNCIS